MPPACVVLNPLDAARSTLAASEKTSAMLQALAATPEPSGDGTLLENTLVPYVTEVARADHSFNNAPFVVFGGAGVSLRGRRFKRYNPRRPVNDMWLACPKAFDVPLTSLGSSEMYTGPLDIMAT